MNRWFHEVIVDTGRLPLFFLLVAFLLAFLFIRFSVRMIRAEVSWWPGNVTPGGMHIHHVMFGLVMMLISGFGMVVLANYETPVANCVFAAIFGVGSALVLDEFALVLHLRDVYWAEEGRSSIDAVFVAIAILTLFMLGVRPIGLAGDFDDVDVVSLIVVLIFMAFDVALAAITLLKGKVWTGLLGIFIVPLLLVGAIRLSRPNAPWARWRYGDKPEKFARAVERETRFREPAVRAKIALQEAVSGRFGVPADLPERLAEHEPIPPVEREKVPGAFLTALRWRTVRRRLRPTPSWRLPLVMSLISFVVAIFFVSLDSELASGAFENAKVTATIDRGATATLLSVIAGAMVTLTGLVFTALTLAMQVGASQISVKVVPILQEDRLIRWSIGMFLSTFAFALIVALDLALDDTGSAPALSTLLAFLLAFISIVLLIALVARVGSVLNSGQLLRRIAARGRVAILRSYPKADAASNLDGPPLQSLAGTDSDVTTVIRLDQPAPSGRILLAVNLARIQRIAYQWEVAVELKPSIGEFVAQGSPLFEVRGPADRIKPHKLTSCLLFGDTSSPSTSPTAAIQTIVDIALKALSTSVTDPGRAIQAIDHLEDMLVLLAPRLRAEPADSHLTRIRGYRRTWADYLAIATDELRHLSTQSAQVQRRLRALFTTLLDTCEPDQHPPILSRIAALDAKIEREWIDPLDVRLARVADPQGMGSEFGATERTRPLIVGVPATGTSAPE
ncbi:DUF2254 domain-containing protein [Antrihabitans sp. YC2-6]|uniref:DUF2254 domain-containing protein n=1 Tax=Antrihabitans sp. YC2-6 TaxID=2799498 RepID=UPI0018F48778|nr:DUF2254 domain-containing protein [Antrihabitans sp. YC2-6]MBJ8348888.1 DUF2254 domain-containing protein [Antrihabitans sp. YC2-6]